MTHTAILKRCRETGRDIYGMVDTRGFLTSKLRFVNRWEAMNIAKTAGQVVSENFALFSDSMDLAPHYRRFGMESPDMAQRLVELEIH